MQLEAGAVRTSKAPFGRHCDVVPVTHTSDLGTSAPGRKSAVPALSRSTEELTGRMLARDRLRLRLRLLMQVLCDTVQSACAEGGSFVLYSTSCFFTCFFT